jgi:hypothetical protein
MGSDKKMQELTIIREKLLADIEEGQRLFGHGQELPTTRTALKHIDETIEQMQKELYGDSRSSEGKLN